MSSMLLGLVGGCGGPPVSRMPVQEQAFALVAARFAPQLGLPGGALEEPAVRWWTTLCPGTELSAVIRGRRCYAGLYYRGDAVDVAWRGSFGTSAYAHELMHYFLGLRFGDSDGAHAQDAAWAVVRGVDEDLQAQGL